MEGIGEICLQFCFFFSSWRLQCFFKYKRAKQTFCWITMHQTCNLYDIINLFPTLLMFSQVYIWSIILRFQKAWETCPTRQIWKMKYWFLMGLTSLPMPLLLYLCPPSMFNIFTVAKALQRSFTKIILKYYNKCVKSVTLKNIESEDKET